MKRKKIFDGKLLKIYTSSLELPDGNLGYFEEVSHPGAALIIPFLKDKIVFIRQYRAVIGKYIWELPAGTLKKGETPYACAKREITEETGYRVKKIKKLGMIHTTPGFCNETIHIYKAECASITQHEHDHDEFIRVYPLSKNEIKKLFKNGKITDSKTIASLAFAGII